MANLYLIHGVYHISIAATAPAFTAHGITRFDTEKACLGCNIIDIKITLLVTKQNDIINLSGKNPDRFSFTSRHTIKK